MLYRGGDQALVVTRKTTHSYRRAGGEKRTAQDCKPPTLPNGTHAKVIMSRSHQQAGGEPSQRMLRVAELIRQAMSDLLVRSALRDPVLESRTITIPEVRVS